MAGKPNEARSSAAGYPQLFPEEKHKGAPAIPLKRPVMVIGSRENCRIRLVSETVSAAHALVVSDKAGTTISDLGSRSHIYINGQRRASALLKTGDMIRVGKFTFRFVDIKGTTGKPLPSPAGMLKVDGLNTPTPLDEKVLLIGRSRSTDLHLLGDEVSRRHAIIFTLGGQHCVRDIGSRTGTFVNGDKVHQVPLKFGDIVRVGNHELRYQAVAQQEMEDELDALLGTKSLVDNDDAPLPPQLQEDLAMPTDSGSGPISFPPREAAKTAATAHDANFDIDDVTTDIAHADPVPAGEFDDLEDALASLPVDDEFALDEEDVPAAPPTPAKTPVKSPSRSPVAKTPEAKLPPPPPSSSVRRGWRSNLSSEIPAPPIPAAPVPPPLPEPSFNFDEDDTVAEPAAQEIPPIASLAAEESSTGQVPLEDQAVVEPLANEEPAIEFDLGEEAAAAPAAQQDDLAIDLDPIDFESDLAAPQPVEEISPLAEKNLTANDAVLTPMEAIPTIAPAPAEHETISLEDFTAPVAEEPLSLDLDEPIAAAPVTEPVVEIAAPQSPADEIPLDDFSFDDVPVANTAAPVAPAEAPLEDFFLDDEDVLPAAPVASPAEVSHEGIPSDEIPIARVVEPAPAAEDAPSEDLSAEHPSTENLPIENDSEPIALHQAIVEPATFAVPEKLAEPGAIVEPEAAVEIEHIDELPAAEPAPEMPPLAVEPESTPAAEQPAEEFSPQPNFETVAETIAEQPAIEPEPAPIARQPVKEFSPATNFETAAEGSAAEPALESLGEPVVSSEPVVAAYASPLIADSSDQFDLALPTENSADETIDLPLLAEPASADIYELPLHDAPVGEIAAAPSEPEFVAPLVIEEDAIDIESHAETQSAAPLLTTESIVPTAPAAEAELAIEEPIDVVLPSAEQNFTASSAALEPLEIEPTIAPAGDSQEPMTLKSLTASPDDAIAIAEDDDLAEMNIAPVEFAGLPAPSVVEIVEPIEPLEVVGETPAPTTAAPHGEAHGGGDEEAFDFGLAAIEPESAVTATPSKLIEPDLHFDDLLADDLDLPAPKPQAPVEPPIDLSNLKLDLQPEVEKSAEPVESELSLPEEPAAPEIPAPLVHLAPSTPVDESPVDSEDEAGAEKPLIAADAVDFFADDLATEEADDDFGSNLSMTEASADESTEVDQSHFSFNHDVPAGFEPEAAADVDDSASLPEDAMLDDELAEVDPEDAGGGNLTTHAGAVVEVVDETDPTIESALDFGTEVDEPSLASDSAAGISTDGLTDTTFGREVQSLSGSDSLGPLGEDVVFADDAQSSLDDAELDLDEAIPPVDVAKLDEPVIDEEEFSLDDLGSLEEPGAAEADSAVDEELSLDDLLLDTPDARPAAAVPSLLDDPELFEEPAPVSQTHNATTTADVMPDLSDLDSGLDDLDDGGAVAEEPAAADPSGDTELPPPSSDLSELFSLGRDQASFLGGMPLQLRELPPPPKDFGRVKVDFGQQESPKTPLPTTLPTFDENAPAARKRDFLAREQLQVDQVVAPPPRPQNMPKPGQVIPTPTNPFDVGPAAPQTPPGPQAKSRSRPAPVADEPDAIPDYDPRGLVQQQRTINTPFDGLAMGGTAAAADEPFAQANKPVGLSFNDAVFGGKSITGTKVQPYLPDSPGTEKTNRVAPPEPKGRAKQVDHIHIPDSLPVPADDGSVPKPLRRTRPEQVVASRPPGVVGQIDHDHDDEPQRRSIGVPLLLTLMILVAAGAWASIWFLTPLKSRINASLQFKNISQMTIQDRNKLNMDLKQALENNDTRRIALQAMNASKIGPGFLDDPIEYSRRMQKAALVETSPGEFNFTFGFDSKDAAGDQERVRAVLTAMDASNKAMADKVERARTLLTTTKDDFAKAQASVEVLRKQIEASRTVGENRPSPATVSELEAKVAKLETAWKEAVEARKAVEADVELNGAGAAKNRAETDLQVRQWTSDLEKLTAQRTAVAGAAATNPSEDFLKSVADADRNGKSDTDLAAYLSAAQQLQQAKDATIGQATDLRRNLEEKLNARRDAAIAQDATLKDLNDQFALSSRRASAAASAGPDQETAAKAEVEKIRKQISSRQDELAGPLAHIKSIADDVSKSLTAMLASQHSPASEDQLKQLDAQIALLNGKIETRKTALSTEDKNEADAQNATRQKTQEAKLATAQQVEADAETNYQQKNKEYLAAKTALDNSRVAALKLDESFDGLKAAEKDQSEADIQVQMRQKELDKLAEPIPSRADSIATTAPIDMRLQYSLLSVGIICAAFIILILMLPQNRRPAKRHGRMPEASPLDDTEEDEEPLVA